MSHDKDKMMVFVDWNYGFGRVQDGVLQVALTICHLADLFAERFGGTAETALPTIVGRAGYLIPPGDRIRVLQTIRAGTEPSFYKAAVATFEEHLLIPPAIELTAESVPAPIPPLRSEPTFTPIPMPARGGGDEITL